MAKSLAVRLRLGDQTFDFQLFHDALALGQLVVQQFWIDKRQLYGRRGNSGQVLSTVLEFYRRYCERENAFEDPETRQTFLLAHLLPNARTIGARRVLADASLRRPVRHGRGADESPVEQLEQFLQLTTQKTVPEQEFYERSRQVLAPREYQLVDQSAYMQLQDQLFHPGVALLENDPDRAIEATRNNWARLGRQFGRRGGHATEKLALDVLSYEARAAYHRCNSLVWFSIIHALEVRSLIDEPTSAFLRLWHLEAVKEKGPGLFRLFHGHVFGLHPATALLIQTASGRDIIGRQVQEPSEVNFQRFLHATLLAIHTYAIARDEYNESRRGTAPFSTRLIEDLPLQAPEIDGESS